MDFGFYRIMHAKATQVTEFLERDLLAIVENAFGNADEARRGQLKAAYERERQLAIEYNAPDPEQSPRVKDARERYEAAADTASAEAQVYDHLYRFFERYYEDGDFISRRYYQRENKERAAAYAIPYQGEEVKLVWANMDQYYIKTTEHFSNFTFDLSKASEVAQNQQAVLFGEAGQPQSARVHFQVVAATEGEHGNVKASEQTTRFFLIHQADPVGFDEQGELICRFEYRPDPEKTGNEGTWRDKRNAEAVTTILATLKVASQADARARHYHQLLNTPAPTEKEKNRPLLARYINQYTARNTRDYFVHKDLGSFLRRELDFYIKNEVMRLDDIENADAPRVDSYLAQIKVLRQIGGAIITFLAQLEDFQKKLWLKKKFVVETNYCITLDRVPAAFYVEIAANDSQREEWVYLFAISEIAPSTLTPGYTIPLTVEFLQANDKLVLDTRFFGADFTTRLLAMIPDLDEQYNGLLIHSENFQALNLLLMKHSTLIDTTYTDPPYNKGNGDDFAYKDSFQHSSWIAMTYDRLSIANALMKPHACLFLSIDENEFNNLHFTGGSLFGYNRTKVLPAITNLKGNQDTEGFASCHEYIVVLAKRSFADIGRLPIEEETVLDDWQEDEWGLYKKADGLRATGANAPRTRRPNLWYPIYFLSDGSDFYTTEDDLPLDTDHIAIWPINDDGEELSWYWRKDKVNTDKYNLIITRARNGEFSLYKKQRPGIGDIPTRKPKSFLYTPEYSSTHGGNLAKDIFGQRMSAFTPKSVKLVEDIIHLGLKANCGTILDYFAGSGTTAHAVINLNREDGGKRKYILVEMGDYFYTILKPRVAKVVYADTWRDGKPANRDTGISHCFKYLRLESYEDCLNNLELVRDQTRDAALAAASDLRADYLLRYMLDVETRGSQSLLNLDAFADPTAYKLKVKVAGSDEYVEQNVDLIETFNYLIGLRVEHLAAPQRFTATFVRPADPELPQDQRTRLQIDGRIRRDAAGAWWFRKVEGWLPRDLAQPDGGDRERVLIVWRKLTGDLEQDNLMLDEWFRANRINPRDWEFDTVYVNGSNNLPNLRQDDETWKVRLIEEEFMRRMWDVEDI